MAQQLSRSNFCCNIISQTSCHVRRLKETKHACLKINSAVTKENKKKNIAQ